MTINRIYSVMVENKVIIKISLSYPIKIASCFKTVDNDFWSTLNVVISLNKSCCIHCLRGVLNLNLGLLESVCQLEKHTISGMNSVGEF